MSSQQAKEVFEQRGSFSKEWFFWELPDDKSTHTDEYRWVSQLANSFSRNQKLAVLSGLFVYNRW